MLSCSAAITRPMDFRSSNFDDTVGAVVERRNAALRVAGSIPARFKYLYGLQVVVPGLAVRVCDFSMFVNVPTIQEVFLE